jgi:hypothetical protein
VGADGDGNSLPVRTDRAHCAIGSVSARRNLAMPDEPIKGYVRAEGLSILATEAILNKAKPLSGYLDIGTEDGRLRLRMNGCAAADLLVDLKNFLALEQ